MATYTITNPTSNWAGASIPITDSTDYSLDLKFAQVAALQGVRVTRVDIYVYFEEASNASGEYPTVDLWAGTPAATGQPQGYWMSDLKSIVGAGWKSLYGTHALMDWLYRDAARIRKQPNRHGRGVITTDKASSNKPYMVVTYSGGMPFVITGATTGTPGRAISTTPNTFQWALTPQANTDGSALYGTVKQQSGFLDWRVTGGTVNTITLGAAGQTGSVVVPANTFPLGSIDWRVRLTSNGGATATSTWQTVTTHDAVSTAEAISPVDTLVTDNAGVLFDWRHIITTGTASTGYELQYSVNGGATWETLQSGGGSATSVTVPRGYTPNGSIKWRVRTKNATGAWGNWSIAATVAVKGAPLAPTIYAIKNTPKLWFSWTAIGQQGYQVRIGGILQLVQFGLGASYQHSDYLPDGDIEIAVRIVNASGAWSDWATETVNIQNQPSEPIALSANKTCDSTAIKLAWQTDGEYTQFYLLRDGVPIAKTSETDYIDYFAIGKCSYAIRGIKGDYYTDSNVAGDRVIVQNAVISMLDKINWLKLEKRRNDKPEHSKGYTANVVYKHFLGREKPVAYTNGQKDINSQISFTYKTRSDFERLLEMVGKEVLYKDCMGAKVIGVLDSLSTGEVSVYDFNFTITETDYKERVAYD